VCPGQLEDTGRRCPFDGAGGDWVEDTYCSRDTASFWSKQFEVDTLCLHGQLLTPLPALLLLFTGRVLCLLPGGIHHRSVHWELFPSKAGSRTAKTTAIGKTGIFRQQWAICRSQLFRNLRSSHAARRWTWRCCSLNATPQCTLLWTIFLVEIFT
jgi:hypothetical protein